MSQSELQNLLERDRELLDQLTGLLEKERISLEARNLSDLDGILQQKQSVLTHIESNDQKRRQLLLQAGVPEDQTSIAQLSALIGRDSDARLHDLLDSIKQRLSTCRELSETNRIIVHRSQVNTQRALDILRGNKSAEKLYNRHGSRLTASQRRNLGQA